MKQFRNFNGISWISLWFDHTFIVERYIWKCCRAHNSGDNGDPSNEILKNGEVSWTKVLEVANHEISERQLFTSVIHSHSIPCLL
jgi:hypothetical protein